MEATDPTHRRWSTATLGKLFSSTKRNFSSSRSSYHHIMEEAFHHDPLDHSQSSIRVIRVLPAAPRDDSEVIRCELRHSTIYDTYMCLSYVWGSQDDTSAVIYVNGMPFKVQSNLKDFLNVAKEKYPNQAFWIDAICIDQSNNLERNHQVQHMGQIYSRARDVLSWLGNDERISKFFRTAGQGFGHDTLGVDIIRNSYWTRAWITQEILLARDVLFLAAVEEMRLDRLQDIFSQMDLGQTELAQLRPLLSPKSWNIRGTNLFRLLALFRNKQCSVKRDRIFSLLSLCDQNLNWAIDYEVSDAALFTRIIQATSDNIMCLCSCWLLSNILDTRVFLQEQSVFRTFEERLSRGNIVVNMYFATHTTNMLQCNTCSAHLPQHWTIPIPTYIFCLTRICHKLRGHLYSDGQNQYLWYASEHKPGLEGINDENFRVSWGSIRDGIPTILRLTHMGLAELMEALSANDTEDGAGPFNICEDVWGGKASKNFTVSSID